MMSKERVFKQAKLALMPNPQIISLSSYLNKEGNIPKDEIEFPSGRRKTELLKALSFH